MNLGELTPDLKVLIDAEIESAGGGGGGGDVPFVGADPPASPSDGELWWDTDDDTPVDGGSQPLTSPLDLTGCVLWLDASELSLGALALWADGSTSGFDAAQATADNQPVVVAGVQNGLPVVRFDPTTHTQYLTFSGAALDLFRDLPGATVAALSGRCVGGADYLLEASSGDDATAARLAFEIINFITQTADGGTTKNIVNAPSGDASGEGIAASCFWVDWQSGIIGVESSPPGLINSGLSPWAGGANSSDTASLAINLGCDLNGFFNNGAQADLGELIVYNRALVAAERRQLLEYLSAKWRS